MRIINQGPKEREPAYDTSAWALLTAVIISLLQLRGNPL